MADLEQSSHKSMPLRCLREGKMSMRNGKAGNPTFNRSSLQSRKDQALQREAKDAWYAERQERRYAAIVDAIQNGSRMMTVEDRKIIATNLGQILNHFEKTAHKKKEHVLRAANMGEPGNSTKQLFNYTLPSLDLASAPAFEKRIPRLVRRTINYRRLAETAAEIAGWDKKGILIDLFKGSSYDVDEYWPGSVPNLPDYLFEMSKIFDRLVQRLIRKTRIEWYYQELGKGCLCDVWGNFIYGEPSAAMLPAPVAPSDLFKTMSERVIPSVVLYRMLAAELPVDFVPPDIMNENNDADWVSDGEPPADAV